MTKTETLLWQKAHDKLTEKYGELIDPTILLRFYHEKALLGSRDWIVFWDLIAKLKKRAREKGEHISLAGSVGASFVAYLLGATEDNPLPLHYYCPNCKNTELIGETVLPWDITPKRCVCGQEMKADGFCVPCESLIGTNHFHLWTSPDFLSEANTFILREAAQYKTIIFENPNDPGYHRYAFLPFDGSCEEVVDINENTNRYNDFMNITITPLLRHTQAARLEQYTGVSFENALIDEAVLREIQLGNVESVPVLCSCFMKELVLSTHPKNYTELLTLIGHAHGTGTWKNNAEFLIKNGTYTLSDIPAHRDDVFMLIRDGICREGQTDVGFDLEAAQCTARGQYAKEGMPFEHEILLTEYGVGEGMIGYLKKIHYMFHKAHSITYLKLASKFLWYKMNYPEIYEKIMTEEE